MGKLNWNYRIVRHHFGIETEPVYYSIHEAYYAKDAPSDGQPEMITIHPCELDAETPEELRSMLIRMLLSTDKPILDYESLFPPNGWNGDIS